MDREEEDEPAVAILDEFDFIHPRGIVWGAPDQSFLWGSQSGVVHEQRTSHVFGGTIELLQDWHKIFLLVQSPTLSPDYIECSNKYRETLEAFLLGQTAKIRQHDQELLQSLRNLNLSLEHYAMHLKLLEDLKSLWHITDMLFVNPARNITASLIDWVQRRFFCCYLAESSFPIFFPCRNQSNKTLVEIGWIHQRCPWTTIDDLP